MENVAEFIRSSVNVVRESVDGLVAEVGRLSDAQPPASPLASRPTSPRSSIASSRKSVGWALALDGAGPENGAASLPASPGISRPETPLASKPTTPIASKPTSPSASRPTTPIASKPTTPIASMPTSPIASKPTSPIASKPTSPIASMPTSPIASKPTSPIASMPTSPIASMPTSPIASKPTSPIASKPTSPIASMPTSPIASMPTSPIASMPASPIASKPTSPIVSRPGSPIIRHASATADSRIASNASSRKSSVSQTRGSAFRSGGASLAGSNTAVDGSSNAVAAHLRKLSLGSDRSFEPDHRRESSSSAVWAGQATELLNIARTSMSPKRSEQLQEALTLLQRVSHSVNLPVMVQQFQAVRFYTGVVELAMKAAENRDRDGLAIRLYHSPYGVNDPATDPQLRKAFLARTECYKCITDMLDDLMVAAESHPHPQSPSVPVEPGPPKLHSTSSSSSGAATLNSLYTALPPEEAQQHAEECLQLLLRSKDELLHITMYEWMLRKNMSEELLHVTSPFLEPFLQRIFDNQDDCAPGLGNLATDLLWRYFERNSKHGQASAVLAQLAEKPGSDRKLDERIELLSRAKMNAKSMTSATANVNKSQKLHELEEKLEVSAIQRRTLLQLRSMGQHQSVARLDSRLYNITALYSEFADPNQLAEIKLAIVHCAGLRDQALIEALWLNVIEFELAKPSNRADPADLPNKLRQKLIDMAQEYANTELYFPLYYLIVTLENISCNRGWELNFVYKTFLACDMPIFHLLVAYNKIHLKKSEGWNSMGHPNRLIWVQACLISDWLEDPDKFSPTGNYKRHFITRSLDIIAGCLVQLHTANQDVHTQKLTSLLKRTQARIENLQTRVRY